MERLEKGKAVQAAPPSGGAPFRPLALFPHERSYFLRRGMREHVSVRVIVVAMVLCRVCGEGMGSGIEGARRVVKMREALVRGERAAVATARLAVTSRCGAVVTGPRGPERES